MWKEIAQLMYLVSPQTFGFNAIDSFHVPVEAPATELGRGEETPNLCGYDLFFTGPRWEGGGQSPVGPFKSTIMFTSKKIFNGN